MSVILAIQFATFIANLLLGFLVLYKNPRSPVHWYFWLFAVGVAGWNLSLFMTISGAGQPLLWGRLAFSLASLMPTGLVLFAASFPWVDKRFHAERAIVLGLGIVFVILPLTNLIIKSVHVVDRTYITGELTPFYFVYLIHHFGFLIWAFVKLILRGRKSRGIQKVQLKYVTGGVILFFVPLFITQLILPIFAIFRFNNLGPLFSIAMISSIAYAITRYRFLDIRVVIQRGLLYVTAISIATALYFFSVFVLGELFRKTAEITPLVSGIISAAAFAIGFPHFRDLFHRATDKIFFKGTYDYYEAMRAMSQALSSTIDLEKLLGSIEEIMRKTLKVSGVLFLLRDPSGSFQPVKAAGLGIGEWEVAEKSLETIREIIVREELREKAQRAPPGNEERKRCNLVGDLLRKSRGALLVPIFSKSTVTAFLMLGDKLSGDAFLQKDFELLNIFSHQAGVALENARLYGEVKEYSDQLEKKVDERTKELKHLYDAQSQFLSDISHELQTPLAVLEGNIGLIQKENGKGHPDSKAWETVDKTIGKMSHIIESLLSLARADSGEHVLEKNVVRLDQLLPEIYEDCQILAQNKNIGFHFQKDADATVLGSREKLKELFLNLVSNALKFTDAGGEIKIVLSKDAHKAKVTVSDTGCGIAEEDLPHIFERFYQSNDKKAGGIGLGLAICKQIVQSHGGTITVRSQLGQGSQFIVSLPLHGNG